MTHDELKNKISVTLGDKVTLLDVGRAEPVFGVAPADIVEVCRTLRDDAELGFDTLCNLGGTDTGEQLQVHYNLASIKHNLRVDLKVVLPTEQPAIDSIQEVWPSANWYEREMWELYGIQVNNHGNLTRFLLPDDWNQGHPMRKNWDAPDFERLPEFLA
jgi:NADH:ubiquinone oxidoreductase subunit C